MRWWDEQMLAPLFEVNERMVHLIRKRSGFAMPELSDAGVCNRLARCPLLLVDVGLAESEIWPAEGGSASPLFAREDAMTLTRMTYVLAWSMTRSDRRSASVVLGVSPRTAEAIASMRLEELYRAAQDRWVWVRPRWFDRPRIWQWLARRDRLGCPARSEVAWLRAAQLIFWERAHADREQGPRARRWCDFETSMREN